MAGSLVTLVVAGLFFVETDAGERWVLGVASDQIRQQFGYVLDATNIELSLARGVIELDAPRVVDTQGAVVFEAERLFVRVELLSLLGRPIRLRELVVDAPRVHVEPVLASSAGPAGGRPSLEQSAASHDDAGAGLRLPVLVDRLEINDGEVIPPDLGERFDGWIDRWTISGLSVNGALSQTELEAAVDVASVVVEGAELGPPISLSLNGRVGGETIGGLKALRVEALQVQGAGLSLEADAELPLDAVGASSATFAIEADAAELTPGLSPRGSLRARGVANMATSALELELEAQDFPTRLLEPWLGEDTFARLPRPDASLDADVTAWVGLSSEPTSGTESSSPAASPAGRDLSVDLDGTVNWIAGETSLIEATSEIAVELDLRGRKVRRFDFDTRVRSAELPVGLLRPWLGDRPLEDQELADSTVRLDLVAQSQAADPSRVALDVDGRVAWSRGPRSRAVTSSTRGSEAEASSEDSPERRVPRLLELEIKARHPALVDLSESETESWFVLAEDLELGARLASTGLPLQWIEQAISAQPSPILFGAEDFLTVAGDFGHAPGRGLEGESRWSWNRAGQALVDLRLEGRGQTETRELLAGGAVSLLPTLLERDRLEFEIASRLTDFGAARVLSAEAGLSASDATATLRDLVDTLPELVPRELAEDPRILALLAGRLELDAELEGELLDVAGDVTLELSGADGNPGWLLTASGRPLSSQGVARLSSDALELSALHDGLQGQLTGSVELELDETGWRGDAQMRSARLGWSAESSESRSLEDLDVALRAADGRLEIVRAMARYGETEVSLLGQAALPDSLDVPVRLPGPARVAATVERPIDGVDELSLELSLDGSTLSLETTNVESPAGTVSLSVLAPLAQLRALPGLDAVLDRLDSFHVSGAETPIEVHVELPECVLGDVFVARDDQGLEDLRLSDLSADLSLDLNDWSRSRGEMSAQTVDVVVHPEGEIGISELTADLVGGSVAVKAESVVYRGRSLGVDAVVELNDPMAALRAAVPDDGESRPSSGTDEPISVASVIESVQIAAVGSFEAELLNRWLGGGVASGVLDGDLSLEGPLDGLRGRLRARGDQVMLTYLSPYETRIEAPDLDIAFEDGKFLVSSAEGRLNEGSVFITGTAWGPGGLDLEAEIGGARYRLDYGLRALLRGSARLVIPKGGRSRLTGDLTLIRGLLRRDIDLDRELRNLLLGLPELTGTDRGFAESLDLDLRLRTSSGVRVNNNLADLRVTWTPLDVRGPLAEPLVKGRLEVDPGGRFFAYGQVVQLDRATVELSGLYGVPPKIDTVTTNSIEDPTLSRFARSDPFSLGGERELDREEVVEAGLLDYYGGRLTSTLERSLGGVRLDYDPLLLFGETEPEARLTVSQDLTTNVAVGVAINLREAERRTYLLDLHDFAFAPGLSSQIFTNEERNQGVTLQHSIQLRGSEDAKGPRIVEIKVPKIPEIDRGDLLDSLDAQEGEELQEGGVFDLEVEVADYLRGHGYPNPRVRAVRHELDAKKGQERVRLDVSIEPGVRAEIDFVGERPSSRARRAIRSLYRSDLFQETALDTMGEQTRTVLRGKGFLEPEVTLEVARDRDKEGREIDRVVVTSRGGRKVSIATLEFPGLAEDEQSYLRSRFVGLAARIELALGVEAADRRLLGALEALGYPIAQVRSRLLSDDGKTLTVELDPGPFQRIVRFEIKGVSDEERLRLSDLVKIQRGDRYRADPIARAALTIEQNLRDRSYLEARVVPRIGLADEGQPFLVPIVFEVEPGRQHTVGELAFSGGRATRESWAKRLVGLEAGEPLEPGDLTSGRRRLIETGAFSLISLDVESDATGLSTVTFDLEERPRFRLSYGLRWESDDGLAAVVDAQDRNVLGRGITLGVRGLVSSDSEQGRIYASLPRAFGGHSTLEAFADVRSVVDDGLITDSEELSLQMSRRFSPKLLGRLYGRYREERFTEEDPDPFFPLDERLRTPTLGVQLVLDRRQQGDLFGSKGLFASVDLSGAGPVIGGDLEYVRVFGQLSWIRDIGQLWGRRLVWAQSYRLGVAEAFDQILSRDVRFFAGGEYSVRGYDSESLGPFERFGSVDRAAGGEALLVINQELRFPIAGRFSGVLFFDAGNVWDDRDDLARDLSSSFGLGLRAATGVGMLRLDVARPLDRRELDDEYTIYIGLGQVF